MSLMDTPVDMVAYLLIMASLPIWWLLTTDDAERIDARFVVAIQLSLIGVFWLVWGGYSTDAWRYLSRFDRDPFKFEEEQLFWLLGHGLNEWLPDPWPLKVLSAAAALIYCSALVYHTRSRAPIYSIISLSVVLILPGFFLLFGNAIRQGLAGAVLMWGMIGFIKGRYLLFIITAAIAFYLHQPSIVFAVAIAASRLNHRWIGTFLGVAPFTSFAAYYVLQVFGIDLDTFIRYASYQEGVFYWAKFFVAYGVAWLFILMRRRLDNDGAQVAMIYASMVAISSLLLKYEVPFERLLLYSDLVLPLVVVSLLQTLTKVVKRAELVACMGIVALGLLLWRHPSIVTALGYSG